MSPFEDIATSIEVPRGYTKFIHYVRENFEGPAVVVTFYDASINLYAPKDVMFIQLLVYNENLKDADSAARDLVEQYHKTFEWLMEEYRVVSMVAKRAPTYLGMTKKYHTYSMAFQVRTCPIGR